MAFGTQSQIFSMMDENSFQTTKKRALIVNQKSLIMSLEAASGRRSSFLEFSSYVNENVKKDLTDNRL